MNFAPELYPKGTFPSQKIDGAFIQDELAKNLDVIAKKVGDDMTFLGLISGHDMVGDGKTTILTHVGAYLTWKINQIYGTNNTFTDKNLVFGGVELEKVSLEMPKYSVIGMDEGDDVTTHGMKEFAQKLKRYFRKCRQLNQILLVILPSFFEFPKFYALNRSHFLIDVFFQGEYERGYFKFYGPHSKKMLYLNGKKEWNYDAWRPDFHGRFFGSYCFFPDLDKCTERYKRKKYEDMVNDNQADTKLTPDQIKKQTIVDLLTKLYQNYPKFSIKTFAQATGMSTRTVYRWLSIEKEPIDEVSIMSVPIDN
jgi:hypothetical protein